MADAPKSTVQCFEDDKAFLTNASATLDWSMPKLMALAVRGLKLMLTDEETPDERAERMLAKLMFSGTTLRNSKTPVRQESHGSAIPVNGSREPAAMPR